MKKIAILHTSFVFVNVDPVFRTLINRMLPEAEIADFVDGQLLAQVRADGGITESSVTRVRHLAMAAEASGADLILSACSSLGPAIDEARRSVAIPIIKVDEAMTDEAVRLGRHVGILATMVTTAAPTTSLIMAQAAKHHCDVQTTVCVCDGAFDLLMAGDRAAHDEAVLAGASKLAETCDVIVLAMASMARLAPMLAEKIGRPVLSSPVLCVEGIAKSLQQPGSSK